MVAIAISSLVFALLHAGHGIVLDALISYLIGGLMFGALAARARSIVPDIVVHVVFDVAALAWLWARDSAPERPSVQEVGVDRHLAVSAAATLALAVAAWQCWRRIEPVGATGDS
jgi:hypothetical protein